MDSGRYRFGVFEFDSEALELRRQGAIVHLQSQPARVLACLIQNSDRTVTREELRAAIWGNETFVDFERGLNFCISQIRSALGDDSARPIYIQTLPKRGYQFVAPVEFVAREIAPQENPAKIPKAPVASRRGWIIAGAAVILLSVAGFAVAHFWRHGANAKGLPIVAVVRFDNETGDPGTTRFSDGLTDNVVERLSALSNSRYEVIGNARILRGPREERDLNAIARELHAKYIVIGQIQSDHDSSRILAHLIRMPEQTHVWVVRADHQALDNPLALETELAQRIGDQFSSRVVADAVQSASHPTASH
ncbi:MAG TPA: winged helix-turn-helix domain-containing protein [Candidatus Acidoferrales bacterium]